MGESRTFNFINSIKGGCGKTTFSIFLARYLDTVNRKTSDASEKSLLLDMDLQGTAMQYLVDGGDSDKEDKKDKKTEKQKYKYLNEAVRIGGEVRDYVVSNRITDDWVLDVVFADSKYSEKEKFRVSSKTGYSPTTQYNVFKGGLQRFLQKLKDTEYRHLIFDMPPNSDGFSGAAFECVMNKAYNTKIKEDDDKVNLFLLTSFDWGQVNETFKEAKALLINKDNLLFDNLFIVFNDNIVRSMDSKIDIPKQFRYNIAGFKGTVGRPIEEKEYKKIHFLRMDAYKTYSTYCMKGTGLRNLEQMVLIPETQKLEDYIPEMPFIEYSDLDNEPVTIPEPGFLKDKIMSTK